MKFLKSIFSVTKSKDKIHTIIRILGIKISIKRKNAEIQQLITSLNRLKATNKALNYRLLNIEKLLVINSGLYDANYYISEYHPEMQKHQAIDYYMKKGYKNFENPSKIFDAKKYKVNNENPIIHYLTSRHYSVAKLFFKNEFTVSQSAIDKFLYEKQRRASKKVVYTCITNDYDNLEDLKAYYYTDSNWDYVCFTDNKEYIEKKQVGIWEIRPLMFSELDNTRNNRWHKTHPHILFPQYEESVYIDANINILTSKFFDLVNITDKDIMLPSHSSKIDLYKELMWARDMEFDNPESLDIQYEIMNSSGFPENYGLFENNIIYRKHNNPEIVEMMEEWWNFIENYSRRDQTSLTYIFWKHGRQIKDYEFENLRIDYKNFCVFAHRKERELCKY